MPWPSRTARKYTRSSTTSNLGLTFPFSTNARGLMSGILQQGYSFGYVLAACASLGVGTAPSAWKKVFWGGAGFSIGIGLIRILFPESKQFIAARAAGKQAHAPGVFWQETKKMLRQEWKMCIYCIILMTWVRLTSSFPPFVSISIPSC